MLNALTAPHFYQTQYCIITWSCRKVGASDTHAQNFGVSGHPRRPQWLRLRHVIDQSVNEIYIFRQFSSTSQPIESYVDFPYLFVAWLSLLLLLTVIAGDV